MKISNWIEKRNFLPAPPSKGGFFCFVLFLLLPFENASAQLSIRSLSTARDGKLFQTFSDEQSRASFYTDIQSEFQREWFLTGVRLEGFNSPDLRALNAALQEKYFRFSQFFAEARWDWGYARLGNYYETFGRGILLRGFELPGLIYESFTARNQKRVIQDFFGQAISLQPGPVSIKILNGKPIDPLHDPENRTVERELGRLTGAEIKFALPGGLSLGGAYLEHRDEINDPFSPETLIKKKRVYATRFLQWSAGEWLEKAGLGSAAANFAFEYATGQGSGEFGHFDADVPYGFYASGNFTWNSFGLSLEYKDYNDFNLVFNDPPATIRENTEALLNRATHTLEAQSEKGYQIEFYYSPAFQTRVVANYTLARNFFDFGIRQLFQERYLGFEFNGDPWAVQFFADSGQDTQFGELVRFTTGVITSYHLASGPTLTVDMQWQGIRPEFGNYYRNAYLSLKVQGWKNFTFAISGEQTEDPDVVRDLTQTRRYLFNGTLGWQPSYRYDVQLFVGKRRSGTYCDHGFCVEVLDFDGIELRLETRI